jgi:hypothetical protein
MKSEKPAGKSLETSGEKILTRYNYQDRLKLDNELMRMRGEFDRYKEQLRKTLI